MKFITKDEKKDKRLLAYASIGIVALSVLGYFSGKPELLIGLVGAGVAILAIRIVQSQTWFVKTANLNPRNNSFKFNTIRALLAIAIAAVLMTLLHFIQKWF
jgi:hypothetical protein